MKIECKGCGDEFESGFEYQDEGLFLATVKGEPSENIEGVEHFVLLIVNKKGEVIVE